MPLLEVRLGVLLGAVALKTVSFGSVRSETGEVRAISCRVRHESSKHYGDPGIAIAEESKRKRLSITPSVPSSIPISVREKNIGQLTRFPW
jgi:hypothetical protein